ncbi:MAG: type II toxin-antitoxin system Phd/YefM family antitoxin [Nitrospinales bacterium]
MKMGAGQFKSKCLKLMDDVHKYHEEIIITKHGKPVAKLVPIGGKASGSLFGYLKGSATIKGNIVKPTGEKWNADG